MAAQAILVVDDDPRIVASIRRALIYEGYRVESAQDGASALRMARERLPDLIVLDVMLPAIDGIELCRRFRADGDVPILMLTAKDATADRVRGLDSGADDYLVKPFAYEELLARVRALLRRGHTRGQAPLRFADIVVDLQAHEASRGRRAVALTAKEFALLECFARHSRRVLTRDQLLEAVWSGDLDATSNVVDVYVGYLRQKLEEQGEPRVIQTVRGVGYVLREE
jgi:two-component system response regulator MprA